MPIYEYQCEKCDCSFELLTVSSEEKQASCPKCGTDQVKRLLSTACFGGSGFSSCGPGSSGGFS